MSINDQLSNQMCRSVMISRGIRYVFLVLWCAFLISTAATNPSNIRAAQPASLASLEIRYHLPEASEVFFIWGIDGWRLLPDTLLPEGTFVANGLMNTPMRREQDTFVATVQVPSGSNVNYAFTITKKHDDIAIEPIWDGDDYEIWVADDQVAEMVSDVQLNDTIGLPPNPLATHDIVYHLPDAGEVYLVWGINGWQPLSEPLLPAGTEVKDNLMSTLMRREGDTFKATVQVPQGAQINYGFSITENRAGFAIDAIWDGYDNAIVPLDNGLTEIVSDMEMEGVVGALTNPLRPQKIRYYFPTAGEVNLIWGINGWQQLPETARSAGTEVKDNLMHTAMVRDGDTFVANINAPNGTLINYGFSITKKREGTPIEPLWDGSREAIVGKDNTIGVYATFSLANARIIPADFDLGLPFLLWVSLPLLLVLILRRGFKFGYPHQPISPYATVLYISISLYVVLSLIRIHIVGFRWVSASYVLSLVPDMLAATYDDLIYVLVMMVLFWGLLALARNRPLLQKIVLSIHIGVALLSLMIAFANIQVLQVLRRPFSYQLLYYSDFLQSPDIHQAFWANLTQDVLLNIATLCLAFLFGVYLLRIISAFFSDDLTKRPLIVGGLISAMIYIPITQTYLAIYDWDDSKLVNPISAFSKSVLNARRYPSLHTTKLDPDLGDFPEFDDQSLEPFQPEREIKNVVIVALESVSASYLQGFSGDFPFMENHRHQAIKFKNIYAHAPASDKGLLSTLGAIYPQLSYHLLVRDTPTADIPLLSGELKKMDYRTGFFSGSTTRDEIDFLHHHQFDIVLGQNDPFCEQQRYASIEGYAENAIHEACLVERFDEWLNEAPDEPFLAMLWTSGTHYPYLLADEEIDYNVRDGRLNRYLNGIRYAEQSIELLIQQLQARGLFDSTLIVLVGDHGEAFGQHNKYVHSGSIYEEEVHVPLIFINPQLFAGEESLTIGGQVDISPTIMHILNRPAPLSWQGHSLFAPNRPNQTYFFTPWADFLFGYRNDNLKLIFNASNNEYQLYDLEEDPLEVNNLADQMPEYVLLGRQHLARWVQHHDQYMQSIFNKDQTIGQKE
ncbi:MAG: sulfatase-like hydrolase/transferase [Chloroflexota bacterium]